MRFALLDRNAPAGKETTEQTRGFATEAILSIFVPGILFISINGFIMKRMWLLFAILSAVFAAATSILAKVGINGVNSNLAAAIRTVVVLLMSWLLVFVTTKAQAGSLTEMIRAISPRSWLFLILSGLATGASWLCYFYALKIGDASKVVPVDKCSLVLTIIFAVIFLGESFTWKTVVGCIMLLAGTLIMIL